MNSGITEIHRDFLKRFLKKEEVIKMAKKPIAKKAVPQKLNPSVKKSVKSSVESKKVEKTVADKKMIDKKASEKKESGKKSVEKKETEKILGKKSSEIVEKTKSGPPASEIKIKVDKTKMSEDEIKWLEAYEKHKAEKPAPYDMKAQFESNRPIQHKILGWGWILSNENDRLEVLFKDGKRMLISNYQSNK